MWGKGTANMVVTRGEHIPNFFLGMPNFGPEDYAQPGPMDMPKLGSGLGQPRHHKYLGPALLTGLQAGPGPWVAQGPVCLGRQGPETNKLILNRYPSKGAQCDYCGMR